MNAILNAEKDGLLIHKNLYDFYIATSNGREDLLNIIVLQYISLIPRKSHQSIKPTNILAIGLESTI